MLEPVRRIEVFTGAGRRRSWSREENAAIIAESYGECEKAVARRHGLTPQQLFLAPAGAAIRVGVADNVRASGAGDDAAGTASGGHPAAT